MQPRSFQGKTVDEAIKNGLNQLGVVSQDEVEITIVQEAKKGFLGIGAKHAVVEISVPEADVFPSSDEKINIELPTTDNPDSPVFGVEDEVSGDEETSDPAGLTADVSNDEDTFSDEDEYDEESENDQGDLLDVEYVAEYLLSVCEAYLAPATVEVEDLGHQITYAIQTDKPGLIIGKHGKIVNSLETLAQVLTHRHVRNRVKVIVNVGDYRERRKKTLERLADRTADEVKRKKQPVFLEPLPASERKIIHNRLAKYNYVVTHSEGKEPHRYLVIDYK